LRQDYRVVGRSAGWPSPVVRAFGALALLGGAQRETIRGLRGGGRDEPFRQIDLAATAVGGLAVMLALSIAFVVEFARGRRLARRSPGAATGAAAHGAGRWSFDRLCERR
jgi:hypothetical protein